MVGWIKFTIVIGDNFAANRHPAGPTKDVVNFATLFVAYVKAVIGIYLGSFMLGRGGKSILQTGYILDKVTNGFAIGSGIKIAGNYKRFATGNFRYFFCH